MIRAKDWISILLGGFLAEAVVFAAAIAVYLEFGSGALLYAAPLLSLVICFGFGYWAAQRAGSRPVLNGSLVGLIAALLYVVLTRLHPEPVAYLVAHVLKVLGGAMGGALAARKGDLRLSVPSRGR